MTDDSIEAKALALVNELFAESGGSPIDYAALFGKGDIVTLALLRAIEQHEAFKQEVSDALVDSWYHNASGKLLERFIISKPDPLAEVITEVDRGNGWDDETDYARQIHKALEARGLEIREKGQ
jgi:hypothetical protein